MTMNLRRIVRDGLGSISRRRKERVGGRGITDSEPSAMLDLDAGDGDVRCWEALPPELLREVARRLEAAWPERRDVVAFASVCRSWRDVCREIAGVPETTGKITFPVALKLPGSRNGPIQCYIKRNKSASIYQLFLGLDTERGKFLLAARKIRHPTYAEYVISTSPKDISCHSMSFMGKLRSNFLGTKFAIYDSQPPYKGAVASSGHPSRRFHKKKVSPKVPSGSYGIAHVAYELNMLGTRGPRRMHCAIYSIPASSLEPNGSVPPYYDPLDPLEQKFSSMSLPHPLQDIIDDSKLCESSRITSSSVSSLSSRFTSSMRFGSSTRFTPSSRFTEVSINMGAKDSPLILRNKPPRWHEQLQCWCLNFRGRVTVASVKNFQLIAASGETADSNTATAGAGTSQSGSNDREKIILQFGKIGKDLFTMDYRYPLSAFQAFAICLSSFDSKLACE